ncbi:Gfo/Idh/MocA family oxidoreductase [Mucilaginibacter sp. CSA2-8R]|uniref:Gfo/Idh/MocA family protein n=1 Tax=Mucilaginibacter sp. CSA2-8R TaxID=3141542 RepID=UPI00315CD896
MQDLSRRIFLEKLGLGAGTAVLASALPYPLLAATPEAPLPADRKLNVALCGLGNYASALADGLQASLYCRLAGVVTGHPEKAREWKQKYNLPDKNIYNYQNFDTIAANKDIDLVYVVLPNALHKEYTVRAARAGKHIICEKPMATSVQDCREMIAACQKAGVQLAIGYRLHYEPTHLEIKRLGQQKVFGQVRMIDAGLGYQTYDIKEITNPPHINTATEWRLNKALSGGGPLMDLGIYCIQAARYIMGQEPVSVTGQYGPVVNKARFKEVEESITWQMNFPGGAVANCTTSCGYNIDRLFASADEGYFELSPALSYGPFKGKTSKGVIDFPVINQQAKQLDEIGKLILQNQPLPSHITGAEGLKDVKIIEAIYQSAQTQKKVMV